ncbi:Wzz/FepE/Etk N-terminal domain-containing protein [Persephonella sp.]
MSSVDGKLDKRTGSHEIIYYQDDEIDLYDLFLVIRRRWKIILAVFTAFFGAAALYLVVSTPLYKGEIYIKNATADGRTVVDINDVLAYLKVRYVNNIKPSEALNLSGYYLDNVSVLKHRNEKSSILKIDVIMLDPSIIEKVEGKILDDLRGRFAHQIEKYILETQKKIKKLKEERDTIIRFKIRELDEKKNFLVQHEIPLIKKKIVFYENKLKKLDSLIKEYSGSIKNYRSSISQMYRMLENTRSDSASKLIITNQIAQYEGLIIRLKSRIKDYELEKGKIEKEIIPSLKKKIEEIKKVKLSQIEKEKSTLVSRANQLEREIGILEYSIKPPVTQTFSPVNSTVDNSPHRPRIFLVLVISVISGIFIGVFIAFVMEWFERARERHRNSPAV